MQAMEVVRNIEEAMKQVWSFFRRDGVRVYVSGINGATKL